MSTLTPTPTSKRPVRRHSRRYPAGRAIAVVLLALFFGALLDADSLVASVSSERFGTARSVELALVRPFRTVSDALGLNLPHRWLADIAGTNQTNPGPVQIPPPSPDAAGGAGAAPAPTSTATGPLDGGRLEPHRLQATSAPRQPARVAGPAPVQVLTPTAKDPVKVWLAGDSMMGDVADAFLGHEAGNPAVTASDDIQIGTGLARPDVYNWPAAVGTEMQKGQPNVVVVMFGGNDDQDMMAGGQYLVRGTPGWQAEYAHRVSLIMSEVAGPGRLLVWMEMPPVARTRLEETGQMINAILAAQARAHPDVVLVDPTPAVAPGGKYTTYLPGSSGQTVQVRASDGVHLTPAGSTRVLPLLMAAIRTRWRVS
jgi:hypothetical protein